MIPPLAPCPFCGSTDVELSRGILVGTRDNGFRQGRCLTCNGIGPWRPAAEAVAMWNRSVTVSAAAKAEPAWWENELVKADWSEVEDEPGEGTS